ncbi:MAG: ornithine carbamoyltransferase, partial [Planctomycetota bacterium]
DANAHGLARLREEVPGLDMDAITDPKEAVRNADVVYTDTWTSMGQEAEKQKRLAAFEGYCVDEDLLALAKPDAIVLHCLPAYRGCEISDGVMESPQSRVFAQAHNRLHAQAGLLAELVEQAHVD